MVSLFNRSVAILLGKNPFLNLSSFVIITAVFAVAVVGVLGFGENVVAQTDIWAESLLIDKPQPNYNPASKPTAITIKGAKNEWLAFQIAVRSDDENLSNFIPSIQATMTDGDNNITDNNFVFYITNYLYVDSNAATYEVPGYWPDACVPYRDRWYNEIRDSSEEGWGQSIPENNTQPFLVELYIPVDTPAGNYIGTIRFTADGSVSGVGGLTQEIPINLTVWDFQLPEQWSLQNLWGAGLGSWNMDNAAFGGPDSSKRKEYNFRLAQSAIDHGFFLYGGGDSNIGVSPSGSFTDPSFDGASDQWSWKRFLDGTVPQGHNPKPYPITSVFCTRDYSGIAMWPHDTVFMDAWVTWINTNGYEANTLFVDKTADEPYNLGVVNLLEPRFDSRHNGYPERPMEYWTSSRHSYPPESDYWDNPYKQIWTVTQFYTWYRSHDWDPPYGSPNDFDSRRKL